MNTRPAWGALTLGALIVIGLLLSPIWLQQFSGYFKEAEEVAPFPEDFYLLSNQAQDVYMDLYENSSEQMAIDLVAARLADPVDVEDPNLPALDEIPTEVTLALTGSFNTLDAIRLSGGTANIYQLSDGQWIVRLESLDAVNGPEMRVLLSAHARPTTRGDLDQVMQFEIDLGELKGSQGNQNYFITSPTFNIENYMDGSSVVLYSARYELIFSFASLAPPEQ
ncbi:MAG: hypothetical protein JXA10_01505 [Anaerolineae bacterium]|nr:hypothetical protein [Anaerolineae bacterium]